MVVLVIDNGHSELPRLILGFTTFKLKDIFYLVDCEI